MSTRCQVKVTQEGMGDWKQSITLYHHTDGYPEFMIPTIAKAYTFRDPSDIKWGYNKTGINWEKGRAGKVASYLCAVDPGTFEPESGHKLHGDIEYYYVLYVKNTRDGCSTEVPQWEIEVFVPKANFWDEPMQGNMTIKHKRQPLSRLLRYYRKKEEEKNG